MTKVAFIDSHMYESVIKTERDKKRHQENQRIIAELEKFCELKTYTELNSETYMEIAEDSTPNSYDFVITYIPNKNQEPDMKCLDIILRIKRTLPTVTIIAYTEHSKENLADEILKRYKVEHIIRRSILHTEKNINKLMAIIENSNVYSLK